MLTLEEELDRIAGNVVLVILKGQAIALLKELRERDDWYSLDFETTGLNEREGRVRLTVIYDPEKEQAYILDHYMCGSFKELASHFVGPTWIVYNAKFETRWFDAYIPNQVNTCDVDFIAKATIGGYVSSLDRMAYRDLGIRLDKTLQNSDWTKINLTDGQYRYAAIDAIVTWRLFKYWQGEAAEKGVSSQSIETMQDAVRGTVECEDTGMTLDVEYHEVNIRRWEKKQRIALSRLRRITPREVLDNVSSDKQVSDFITPQLGKQLLAAWPKTDKKKQLKISRDVIGPIARRSPYPFSRWLNALMLYRYYNKYLSTYGETLVTKQHLEGRITYRLNIGQAATCRYSSSTINIQNIPRAAYVRRSFRAPPGYEFLVAADYSGIEIRVLAELADDEQLRHDAIYGNMHASMAAEANHILEQDFLDGLARGEPRFKELRSKAKAGTFRLTYGAGAGAVADSLHSSVEYAEEFIRKWAARYPKAWHYRQWAFDYMMMHGQLPVIDGRFIYIPKMDRTLPVAANYPIQGAAASVMLAAIGKVKAVRDQRSTPDLIRLVATVHDELLLACNEPHIEQAKAILEIGMVEGWLTVFPNTNVEKLIEIGHGRTWGDAK